MKDTIYGIDFGTTNSAIAIMRNGNETVLKSSVKSDKTERSILFFPKWEVGKFYVGEEAIEHYLLNRMEGRFMQSIKSFLPDTLFEYTWIHGKKYTIEELVSLILSDLKHRADESLNYEVTKAVFGRPVIFSEIPEDDKIAEQRLYAAALKAGFKEVYFQLEPIAAALAYELRLNEPEVVLVADLGGGTSDFTIMQLDPQKVHLKNRTSDILATGGIRIGGNNFDSDIMWHKLVAYFGYGAKFKSWDKWLDLPITLFRNLCRWEKINLLKNKDIRIMLKNFLHTSDNKKAIERLVTLIEKDLGFSIFSTIEETKKILSYYSNSKLDYEQFNIIIHEEITLNEFNHFINEQVEKFETYLISFINNSNVDKNVIQTVFITGGSSLVPALRNVLIKLFGEDKIRGGESFTSVASGLALSSSLYF